LIRNRRDDPKPGGDLALQTGPEGIIFVNRPTGTESYRQLHPPTEAPPPADKVVMEAVKRRVQACS
jgi:hypothetical protein